MLGSEVVKDTVLTPTSNLILVAFHAKFALRLKKKKKLKCSVHLLRAVFMLPLRTGILSPMYKIQYFFNKGLSKSNCNIH